MTSHYLERAIFGKVFYTKKNKARIGRVEDSGRKKTAKYDSQMHYSATDTHLQWLSTLFFKFTVK